MKDMLYDTEDLRFIYLLWVLRGYDNTHCISPLFSRWIVCTHQVLSDVYLQALTNPSQSIEEKARTEGKSAHDKGT